MTHMTGAASAERVLQQSPRPLAEARIGIVAIVYFD
jgi:hypothetical protein